MQNKEEKNCALNKSAGIYSDKGYQNRQWNALRTWIIANNALDATLHC